MLPASFDISLSEEWSLWVLAHGLPDLPGTELDVGQSVPVAYWISPTTAAVLHIRVRQDPADSDDDCDEDPAAWTETDIEPFVLIDGDWVSWSSGGGGWTPDHPLAPIDVAPEYVSLAGMAGMWSNRAPHGCTALHGEVGTAATHAEVTQGDHVTQRPLEAPTGAFVVCAEPDRPFTVRILDQHGTVLYEMTEQAAL